mmetsp:Transcript_24934/g.33403  ORF Transcript_24934/g.33403 Transcript_24934/m.33403 type:complete len:94 (-) Transcript_24934:1506-1787(-)
MRKILKFEKVIKQFCEKLGVDQQAMLSVLYPEHKGGTNKNSNANVETINSNSDSIQEEKRRPLSSSKEQKFDTRKAALLAYTNLENASVDEVP